MRRAVRIVGGAAVALAVAAPLTLSSAEASGSSTVVVRGTAIPDGGRAQLDLVGCAGLFSASSEPITPMLGLGPDGGPAGKRSLAFAPTRGSAIGSLSYVDRVAATTVAGMSVHAQDGTTGVAYVGYQAPIDRGTSTMWVGRAELTAPAGVWTTVEVTGLDFAWTRYDLNTGEPMGAAAGSSGIPAFVREMGGDGYGFYLIGFGCDGHEFNTDAWRIGTAAATTTYDFEGYGTRTTILGPSEPVAAGEQVTLRGRVVDDLGSPADGARVVLQALEPGGDPRDENDWATVRVATGADVSESLRVAETTTYRWKVFTTPSTDGSASEPLTVTVADPGDPPAPTPSDRPSDRPSDEPSDRPSERPSERPSGEPNDEPSGEPSGEPSDEPSEQSRRSAPAQQPTTTPAARPESAPGPDSGLDSGPDSGLDSGPDSGAATPEQSNTPQPQDTPAN